MEKERNKLFYFDEKTHTYWSKGKRIPSVSQILSATIFKNKYKDVPPAVLNAAAEFGTNVHYAIETDTYFFLSDQEYRVYSWWKEIEKENFIIVKEQEQKVFNQELWYAGTYDAIANVMGYFSLIDFKTTYSLDLEYLSWQLSMYAYANQVVEKNGIIELLEIKEFDKYFVVWLPKRKKGEVVEIPKKSYQEIEWLVNKYKEEQK